MDALKRALLSDKEGTFGIFYPYFAIAIKTTARANDNRMIITANVKHYAIENAILSDTYPVVFSSNIEIYR